MALCGVLTANAASVGDYIYTADAKLKVTGENIVTNGNFASASTEGWTTVDAGSVDMAAWSLEAGVGPNGENVLQSADATSNSACVSVTLTAGNIYVVSYDIYSPNGGSFTAGLGNSNAITIFVNSDGSFSNTSDGYRLTNEAVTVAAGEWTTVTDTVFVDPSSTATMLQIAFQKLTEGTQITNVSVNQASDVYDDRIAKRALDIANYLYNSDEWANANEDKTVHSPEDFEGVIAYVQELVDANTEDKSEMEDALTSLSEAQTEFLNANSADMSGVYTSWTDTSTKYQKATQIGAWALIGGRWFHMNGSADTQDNIYSTIQGTYDLVNASATLTQSMSKGRYLFGIDMKGYYMVGSASSVRYTPNYESKFYGATVFANGDTTICDTLPTRYYDTYFKFFDAPEGENNVVVGATWTIPDDMVGKKLGGAWFLANDQLRMLGTTTDEQTKIKAIQNIIAQQSAMNGYITILDSLINKTECSQYPWGKDVLQDSLNLLKERYNESLTIVDAEGNYVAADDSYLQDESGAIVAKGTYYNTLVAYNKYCNTSRSAFFSTNNPYTTLVSDLEASKASYEAGKDAASASTKATFESEIQQAQALVDNACNTTADDAETYTSADESLMAAKAKFEASAATYENPSTLDIINPNFDQNSSGYKNITATGIKGWTYTANDMSKECFTVSSGVSGDNYDSDWKAQVWRGNTVSPHSKLVQEYTLPEAGMYEYRASAMAFNENKAYDVAMGTITSLTFDETEVADTAFAGAASNSEVKLIFGQAGTPDSVRVHSKYLYWNGSTSVDGYKASKYSVFYFANAAEEASEFGLYAIDQIDKAGANTFAFGDNVIYYYGSSYDGTVSGVKEELQNEITTAQNLYNEGVAIVGATDWRLVRLYSSLQRANEAIATASPASSADAVAYCKLLKNAYWDLIAQEVYTAQIITGIESIKSDADAKKAAVKGVFTISGVKVASDATSLENLPSGLYIINGKKFIKK